MFKNDTTFLRPLNALLQDCLRYCCERLVKLFVFVSHFLKIKSRSRSFMTEQRNVFIMSKGVFLHFYDRCDIIEVLINSLLIKYHCASK